MTQWGALLLCTYIALGATSRLSRRKAGQVALVLTTAVVAIAMLRYMDSAPTDPYYKSVDGTVYATGQPAPALVQASATSENVTGVQPATPADTITAPIASGGGS